MGAEMLLKTHLLTEITSSYCLCTSSLVLWSSLLKLWIMIAIALSTSLQLFLVWVRRGRKGGIFDGPQIRKLMKDPQFISSMSAEEGTSWKAFEDVCKNYLGNNKSANYKSIVEELMSAMKDFGCNMSIKIQYLHSQLDWFSENLGDISEEQDERFHQNIKVMEEHYQHRWNCNMMADYCWSLKRVSPDLVHARKSLKLVSTTFYQIFIFHQIIAFRKLWKMFFILSKKLFSFSRYSNLSIFVFPSFFLC